MLMSGNLLYVDTNILIYLLEKHEPYSTKAAEILDAHAAEGGKLVTSTVTITEFLAGTVSSEISTLYMVPGLEFVVLDEALAASAADMQRDSNLRIGDAIHLATAVHMRCGHFFTNDKLLAASVHKYLPVKSLQ
jgi:predicted nucleic acid-binding protein